MTMPDTILTDISLKETAGIARQNEPLTTGIPFPCGAVFTTDQVGIFNGPHQIPCGAEVLKKWPDNSIKWALFDFQVTLSAYSALALTCRQVEQSAPVRLPHALHIEDTRTFYIVNTGPYTFHVDRQVFRPIFRAVSGGEDCLDPDGASVTLVSGRGTACLPQIERSCIETQNPLRTVLRFEGIFTSTSERSGIRFISRLVFYAGHSFVRCDLSIWNPNAAHHPGGLWDLGDTGSLFFQELTCRVPMRQEGLPSVSYCTGIDGDGVQTKITDKTVHIYQASSGGENWQSRNHVNRLGKVMLDFKGYRVQENDTVVAQGTRATPVLTVTSGNKSLSGTMVEFWQNFPSAVTAGKDGLALCLFPKTVENEFELQGGEQKTHRFYLDFHGPENNPSPLAWSHDKIVPILEPSWYARCRVFSHFVPQDLIPKRFPFKECTELKDTAVSGPNSFFLRREIIDEYGWRHFGDLYADHENLLFKGNKPVISHYNNQYDLIFSFVYQFAATGNHKWFTLAEQLARHVADIDIYHTDEDTYRYNHGLFWHTDHYCDAHTATHRGYSIQTKILTGASSYGGGPSYEHVYLQGLAACYFMTGDMRYKEAAMELSEFARNGVQGPKKFREICRETVKTNLGFVKALVKKSGITPYELTEGPGRASGNVLAALIDGFNVTGEHPYLSRAEYLIKRCVHPAENLEEKNLDDVNMRWAYTLFFQSVGRYLDVKIELNNIDAMYGYAKNSLLHYADWMVENEQLFLSHPELLDYPNFATRACNDLRKPNVLLLAARFAPKEKKQQYMDKAWHFFETIIHDLQTLEGKDWTRPLAQLLQNIPLLVYGLVCSDCFFQVPEYKVSFFKSFGKNRIQFLLAENIRLLKNIGS